MKLVCRPPIDGSKGLIYIYNLSPLEYVPMLEEVRMTKRWVDVLYEEEKG